MQVAHVDANEYRKVNMHERPSLKLLSGSHGCGWLSSGSSISELSRPRQSAM